MDTDEIQKRFLMLRHPFTSIVCGPTGSGKTDLIRAIINSHVETIYIELNDRYLNVLWCFGVYQDQYEIPLSNTIITYYKGIPSAAEIASIRPDVIVFDDLQLEVADNPEISNLFTRGSHHLNISVFLLVQNLFQKGKAMRNSSLNAQYIFLLKNVRDRRQIITFASQMFPGDTKHFMESYNLATGSNFGYLLIDLKNDTPDAVRLRSKVLPINGMTIPNIWTQKK
jgi:Poxvirus A32 protein